MTRLVLPKMLLFIKFIPLQGIIIIINHFIHSQYNTMYGNGIECLILHMYMNYSTDTLSLV